MAHKKQQIWQGVMILDHNQNEKKENKLKQTQIISRKKMQKKCKKMQVFDVSNLSKNFSHLFTICVMQNR